MNGYKTILGHTKKIIIRQIYARQTLNIIMCPKRRIDHSNTSRWISMNDLNIIANPLNQELMQGRRYAMVGMNPILPQDNYLVPQ
jgi:hypothetical protein